MLPVAAERHAIPVAIHADRELQLRFLIHPEAHRIPGPHTDGVVVACRSQPGFVRAERHPPDLVVMLPDDAEDFSGVGVMYLHGELRSFPDQVAATRVRTWRKTAWCAFRASPRDGSARFGVPNVHDRLAHGRSLRGSDVTRICSFFRVFGVVR